MKMAGETVRIKKRIVMFLLRIKVIIFKLTSDFYDKEQIENANRRFVQRLSDSSTTIHSHVYQKAW